MTRSGRCRHHEIAPVRIGHLHRRSTETRAAPDPRGGAKRPPCGAGRALPGGSPRAGHLVGQPYRANAVPVCEPEDARVRGRLMAHLRHSVSFLQGREKPGDRSCRLDPMPSDAGERLIGAAALAAVIPALVSSPRKQRDDGGLWYKVEVHLRDPSPGDPDCTAARWGVCSPRECQTAERA